MTWIKNGAFIFQPNPNYPDLDRYNPTIEVYDPTAPFDDMDPSLWDHPANVQFIQAYYANQAMAAAQAASQAAADLQAANRTAAADNAVRAAMAVEDAVAQGNQAQINQAATVAQAALASAAISVPVAQQQAGAAIADKGIRALDNVKLPPIEIPPSFGNNILNYGLKPKVIIADQGSTGAISTGTAILALTPAQRAALTAGSGVPAAKKPEGVPVIYIAGGLLLLYWLWNNESF